MRNTNYYESVQVSEKIGLEEFLVSPSSWLKMLVVAFFAPSTLFRSVKYGGPIGLPSALFLIINSYYCAALLHSGSYDLNKSLLGGVYLSLVSLAIWYLCSAFLFKIRKKMTVHPRFYHFIRFAVWNQLLCLMPFTLAYLASLLWPVAELLMALVVCVSFGYSIYGFISVFRPRSVLVPMATLFCALSLFSTLSLVVGLRGVDGVHTEVTAWMDPRVAVPRLEYHYHNQKRVLIANYRRLLRIKAKPTGRSQLASN